MASVSLFCNCRRVIGRATPGSAGDGEWRVVKSRRWDCPSCGLNRKRTLARMCSVAGAVRIITLTFTQPEVLFIDGPAPGQAPDTIPTVIHHGALRPRLCKKTDGPGDIARIAYTPARHRCIGTHGTGSKQVTCSPCDPATHVALNVRNGGYRWRVLASCPHCCRYVSHTLDKWRQSMRKLFPSFGYLHAREEHKSGSMHLHVAVIGIDRSVTRKSDTAALIERKWKRAGMLRHLEIAETGSGFIDVGRHGDNAGDGAGWYVGKYLAKQHETATAKGFRRWSKSGNFAPSVKMGWTKQLRHGPVCDGAEAATGVCLHPSCQPDWHDPGAPIVLRGWIWPDGTEQGRRFWRGGPEDPSSPTAAYTVKYPLTASGLPDGLLWGAPVPYATGASAGLDSKTANPYPPGGTGGQIAPLVVPVRPVAALSGVRESSQGWEAAPLF